MRAKRVVPPLSSPDLPTPEVTGNSGKCDLEALFLAEVEAVLALMPGKRNETSYKDLVSTAASLTEKILRLRGAVAVSPEELARERDLLLEVLRRHITDPTVLAAVAAELAALES